jgi:aldehyde:ferredoxin oxidoreductase
MGGACLGAYYLLNEMEAGLDAFDPGNLLVFATGVATGAPGPGLARHTVITKSPLTGGIGESQAEGFWGSELKNAGFDAIVIRGKAKEPAYISIVDDGVEIKSAKSIWGKFVADAHEAIVSQMGDPQTRIALIGPAGENLVRYASIITDLAFAHNRTGVGAVMGSKNLKALAVRGHGRVEVADPKTVNRIYSYFAENFKENAVSKATHELGMGGLTASLCSSGLIASKNYESSYFENIEKAIGPEVVRPSLGENIDCYSCPQGCQKKIDASKAPGVDVRYAAPELELLGMYASNCCIDDYQTLLKINEACYKYGLDRNSSGGVVAFVMECYERGILTKEELGGLELRFGSREGVLKLLEMIAFRTGIGDVLAEGTKRASEKIGKGTHGFAMQSKGVELPTHDPRAKGMVGLGYAVSPIGPCTEVVEHDTDFDDAAPAWMIEHNKTVGVLNRIRPDSVDDSKTRLFYNLQMVFSLMDSLCLCIFAFVPVRFLRYREMTELLSAVTGWEVSLWELMKVGERRINLFRVFNIREGLKASDDWLPERMFSPIPGGPRKGHKMDKKALKGAIRLYYQMAGWDGKTGIPKKAKLIELDIPWAIKHLEVLTK